MMWLHARYFRTVPATVDCPTVSFRSRIPRTHKGFASEREICVGREPVVNPIRNEESTKETGQRPASRRQMTRA